MDDDGNPNPPLAASDLVLIDDAVLLLAYMSSAGSTDQTLIGCRQVSYFKPLEIAVLNTTVIFEDYEHQKNLDPLQKLTGDYIKKELPVLPMQRALLSSRTYDVVVGGVSIGMAFVYIVGTNGGSSMYLWGNIHGSMCAN